MLTLVCSSAGIERSNAKQTQDAREESDKEREVMRLLSNVCNTGDGILLRRAPHVQSELIRQVFVFLSFIQSSQIHPCILIPPSSTSQ